MSNIQKLPDSDAGQATPGLDELHYKAYLQKFQRNKWTYSIGFPFSFEQWKNQQDWETYRKWYRETRQECKMLDPYYSFEEWKSRRKTIECQKLREG